MMEVSISPQPFFRMYLTNAGMMNGLQSLDTWKASFNDPDANRLAM
jgi:hypothetical protein